MVQTTLSAIATSDARSGATPNASVSATPITHPSACSDTRSSAAAVPTGISAQVLPDTMTREAPIVGCPYNQAGDTHIATSCPMTADDQRALAQFEQDTIGPRYSMRR